MICGLYLIVPFLKKIIIDRDLIKYFLILAFIFCFILNVLKGISIFGIDLLIVSHKINMKFVGGYSAYFILGYFLHNYELENKLKKVMYTLSILAIIINITGTYYFIKTNALEKNTLLSFLSPTVFLVSFGVFLFFKENFNKSCFNDFLLTKIYMISKYSFGIYLVHMFFVSIIDKSPINTISYSAIASVPLTSIIVLILSFISVWIIDRIPILKKYII